MTSRTWPCEISKNLTWNPTFTAKNTPLFLFPYMGHSLQIFTWGMPRHAHVFSFTHNAMVLRILDVFTPKIRRKFLILTFLWIKTNVAYTRLEVIAKQRSALQVEFITGVKLICYFVLYCCFLQWDHLPNMAVGDLAFYYTLYLWVIMADLCLLQALDAAQAINSIEAINNNINNPHPGRIIVDYDNPFEGLTDKDFKDRFCFTKPRVLYLCELLHTYLERPTARSKAFPVPLKFCLLWKQESYQCGRKGSRTGGGDTRMARGGYQACPWTHKKHPNHVFFRYENRP